MEGVLLVVDVAGHDEWYESEVLFLPVYIGVVLEELKNNFVVVIPVALDGEIQRTES